MPKVAIVYPYFRTRSSTEMLFPPLGSAALKGQLNARGIQSRIFDGTFTTPAALLDSLRAYAPDIIGIYSMISLSRAAFALAAAARDMFPALILAAGGPLPTLYPERFAAAFDVVFRGEAEGAFPAFCDDVLSRGMTRARLAELPLESYDGLFLSHGNLRVNNPSRFHDEREIDTFPLPDRTDFDHAAYQAAWMEADGTRTSSLMTTYGCPYDCDFCSKPVFGNRYRKRSLGRVFQEIDALRDLGYDTLWIADDSFTLSIPRLREFCQAMTGKGMRWNCLSRVNGIDPDTARMMREAGCRRVYLGMESGSPRTLLLMNKRATVEDGVRATHLFSNAGIEVAAFFMVGYPGETVESIEETFRFSLSLPLASVSFNVPFPLPGSPLFSRVSGLDTGMDWNTENEVTFVFRSEFDQDWMQRRIRQTMDEFARARRA